MRGDARNFLHWLAFIIVLGAVGISATGCIPYGGGERKAARLEKPSITLPRISSKDSWENTGTPTFTPTRVHIKSATPSSTSTPTSTARASRTPTRSAAKPTRTPKRTATFTPSTTPTSTFTYTPANTATPTFTATSSSTASATSTPTQTVTADNGVTGTALITSTVTPTKTATATSTSTSTPTFAPTDHVLISEFRTRGQNGAGDEFIELFNAGDEAVDIGGWLVKKSSGCGTTTTTLVTLADGVQLLPGQHFLAAPSGASVTSPDQSFTAGIADNGGVALFNDLGIAIDKVGMCSSTSYLEGEPLSPITSSNLDRSYERLPGGTFGNCHDTDNNLADLKLISPSNPQNLSSPETICSDMATATATDMVTVPATETETSMPTVTSTATDTVIVTPTFTPTASETVTPSPTPTITGTATATLIPTQTPVPPNHILISEFRTRGQNGASDEFIELFNPSGQSMDISGWLIKKSSDCGSSTIKLLAVKAGTQLLPGGHFLAAPAGASAGNPDQTFTAGIADSGGIALFNDLGTVIDQAGMCAGTSYFEGNPLSPMSSSSLDRSYERAPGGALGSCYDTDNNLVDISLTFPSNPQNLSSPLTFCAGVETSTPTVSATETPVSTPTYTPSPTPTSTATVFTSTPSATATSSPSPTATVTPTRTPTLTDTPSATATASPSPTATATVTPTSTPTLTATGTEISATPAIPPDSILISEVRTRGQNGASDELIELFNPTDETVDIGGWLIKRSSGCGSSTATLLTLSAGTQLLPGQHFLAAPSGASVNNPDQNFTAGIADNGGIALLNQIGTVIDQAGMCASTLYLEGDLLPPLASSSLDRSYERKPGGAFGNCIDTDNNLVDFTLISPSDPQNLSSPLTVCADEVTVTHTPSPTTSATDTPTATATHTPSPTATATVTHTATATITDTPTQTATHTQTPTTTATDTPTATPTATLRLQ